MSADIHPFPTPAEPAEPAPTLTPADRWRIGEAKAKAIEATRPAWAQAVIVAELEESRCDSMSDYFNSETMRRVVLAWSKHKRDLFPELRAAAATFEETADLGPGCDIYRARIVLGADVVTHGTYYSKGQHSPWHTEPFADDEKYGRGKRFTTRAAADAFVSANAAAAHPIEMQTAAGPVVVPFEWQITHESIEHREKYSMGHGYYLSAGGRYSGWQVRKTWTVDGHPNLESRIGASAPAPAAAPVAGAVDGITVSRNAERSGLEIRFPSKPDDATRDRLKAAGWRWSRFSSCWYTRDSAAARTFAAELTGRAIE
jgi:hypothetical protein